MKDKIINYKKCIDIDERCELLANMGECEDNPTYMLRNCDKSCNNCVRGEIDVGINQAIISNDKEDETMNAILSSIKYYETEVLTKNPNYNNNKCDNKHMLCSYWSSKPKNENDNNCIQNKEFMMNECSLACQTCLVDEDDAQEDDNNNNCVDLIENCEELKEAERCFYIDVIPVCRKTCNNCVAKSDYGVKQEFHPDDDDHDNDHNNNDNHDNDQLEKLHNESIAFFENEIVYYPEFPRIRENCKNLHSLCTYWANIGECTANKDYMNNECSLACKTCLDLEISTSLHCKDHHEFCKGWANENKCATDAEYMQFYCANSCKSCILQYDVGNDQSTSILGKENEIKKLIKITNDYYINDVLTKSEYVMVRRECKNRHQMCTAWAVLGECEKNPYFMEKHCSIACQSCLQLDHKHRCPIDNNEVPAWRKDHGDLNNMFLRIINEYYDIYNPIIYSKPKDIELPSQYYLNNNNNDIKDGPWIITLDNFLTIDESDRLIEYGHLYGYTRSSNVGTQQWDGSYKPMHDNSRTSTNAWCNAECNNDILVQSIKERIVNITNITKSNHETLQLLKYDIGQYYKSHHDYIPHHSQRQYGPRILTVFLYLNDVLSGGGTKFNTLDITVQSKKGRVLLWPSVLDNNPMMRDFRTNHEALVVERGIKYGANVWIHLRDIQKAIQNGCE